MTDALHRRRPVVYLAGPGVFRADAELYGALQKSICDSNGLAGMFPLDGLIAEGVSDEGKIELARRIYWSNTAMMDLADGVVADITPFRGPNMDPGTAFEIGYFAAREKPIFCFTKDHTSILSRMRAAGLTSVGDKDLQGLIIEDFGLSENLMIAVPAKGVYESAQEAIEAAGKYFAEERTERVLRAGRAL